MKTIQSLMDDIYEWSQEAFGKEQRSVPILHHLSKEVKELIEAISHFQKNNTIKLPYNESCKNLTDVKEEYADCFMLILDSASNFGLSAKDLIVEAYKKLEINKGRKWGSPDDNGVIEHKR